jgi:hypothetical protein
MIVVLTRRTNKNVGSANVWLRPLAKTHAFSHHAIAAGLVPLLLDPCRSPAL